MKTVIIYTVEYHGREYEVNSSELRQLKAKSSDVVILDTYEYCEDDYYTTENKQWA